MKVKFVYHKGKQYRLHVDLTNTIVGAEICTVARPGEIRPIPLSSVPVEALSQLDLGLPENFLTLLESNESAESSTPTEGS
jgi:hypothetical protein